ncbi:glycoside hydrolase family 27 protein [Asticcacaulis sp. 201]|uniref:glycoside hydrolase family 27 protein n=1 Tax=Asticcacaulis sp. 201 TaxID=3028787 RepID=UPI0029170B6C|nr:glycoside hydrolase family 27 protein [Asticcacaulis sp. 201]MDV6330366.1 glycoside hydrolase family 27 protein [Asticcacaulis sp. 201]
MRRLMITTVLAGLMAAASAFADAPKGAWVFDNSPEFPGFTRLIIDGDHSRVTSKWYGDLPLTDLKQDGDTLVFKLYNGNPRVAMTDIIVKPDGDKVRMTGKVWYQDFDMTAHKGDTAEVKALDFPAYPLPDRRVVTQKPLAATPPMGWSSWNKFATNINDKTIREIADALVSSGLRDAGYIYVNIDDGWQGQRDANGALQPNAHFPDMKALADYVHARGLKLGLYSSPGPKTCAGYEGSYGHIKQDAQTFADWGVDYLKYDLCSGEAFYHTPETVYATYQEMGEALNATGRDIVYSLCQYGRFDVGAWGRQVGGHLWRTTGDIEDNYDTMAKIGFDKNGVANHTGPNGWNDPDMLEVGNGGMTTDEYRTHMSLWALMAAPLVLGNDVRTMTPETLALLTNREVIAIDQDRLGAQGLPVQKDGTTEIWTKKLSDGTIAVGLFNRGLSQASVTIPWDKIGLKPKAVRDVWNAKEITPANARTVTLPAHGAVLLKVKPAL